MLILVLIIILLLGIEEKGKAVPRRKKIKDIKKDIVIGPSTEKRKKENNRGIKKKNTKIQIG